MTEDPAIRLREAATLIREAAETATQGPWTAVESIEGGDSRVIRGGHPHPCSRADATWIALMYPGIGGALAAWLESTARYWGVRDRARLLVSDRDRAALALADAILRGVTP